MARNRFGLLLADPRPCEVCGSDFSPRVDQLQRGDGRFCSGRCAGTVRGRMRGRVLSGNHLPSPSFLRDGEWVCTVPLSPAGEALISAEDRERVADFAWRMHSGGYVLAGLRGGVGNTYLHRFILNPPPDLTVDHINGNRLDNRRSNLRAGSVSRVHCGPLLRMLQGSRRGAPAGQLCAAETNRAGGGTMSRLSTAQKNARNPRLRAAAAEQVAANLRARPDAPTCPRCGSRAYSVGVMGRKEQGICWDCGLRRTVLRAAPAPETLDCGDLTFTVIPAGEGAA